MAASVVSTPSSTVTGAVPKQNRNVVWRHSEKDSPGNESKCKLCGDLGYVFVPQPVL